VHDALLALDVLESAHPDSGLPVLRIDTRAAPAGDAGQPSPGSSRSN
jgi:hypothetical protein